MAETSNSLTRDEYVDCLTQQLSEYELLKSMYPNQGEILLSDKDTMNTINKFIDGEIECIPNHLDFKLNLFIETLKFEVFINLPSSYPKEEPDIYVRCNKMNRQNESRLNSKLLDYIKDNHIGEVCLYTAISWLQENVNTFATITHNTNPSENTDVTLGAEDEYARLWVYSHHIYNKRKREDIIKRARDLKLTGFSLAGKPGIVCVEGRYNDCKDWWKDIKSMSWKKIEIRKTETFEAIEEATYKKFSNFVELNSKNPVTFKHYSMSDLSKLMTELGLSHIFNELFGFCNDD